MKDDLWPIIFFLVCILFIGALIKRSNQDHYRLDQLEAHVRALETQDLPQAPQTVSNPGSAGCVSWAKKVLKRFLAAENWSNPTSWITNQISKNAQSLRKMWTGLSINPKWTSAYFI